MCPEAWLAGVWGAHGPAAAAGGGRLAERSLSASPQRALAPWGVPSRAPRREERQRHEQQLLRGPGLNPTLGDRGRGRQDWEGGLEKWGAEGEAESGQVLRKAPGATRDATVRIPPPGLTPPAPLPNRRALRALAHGPRLAPRLADGALGAPRFVLPAAGVHLV